MLQVQTPKPATTFNRSANIRTDTPTSHSMMKRVFYASIRSLTIDMALLTELSKSPRPRFHRGRPRSVVYIITYYKYTTYVA